jgi:hypothetical protein
MRKGDTGVAIRKVRDLLPPSHMVAADAMGKDDRRA